MAESIKKFIIKDAHGGTKEQGSFSVVGEVHVNIVPGYGEPYADSEYVDGVLTITIHNIEGNGITDITTDSQEGDEAVNTVTIKTNANPEGVTLEVRNGSRGNGIASSSEVLSPDDGGVNTHTFVDTDGDEHVFHTTNGHTGPQGIPGTGAIWTGQGEEIMTLEQEIGQAINKAMSQKAVTDELSKATMATDALGAEEISSFGTAIDGWINSTTGEIVTTAGSKHYVIPVTNDMRLTIIPGANLAVFIFASAIAANNSWTPVGDRYVWENGSSIVVPDDAKYLIVGYKSSSTGPDYTPSKIFKSKRLTIENPSFVIPPVVSRLSLIADNGAKCFRWDADVAVAKFRVLNQYGEKLVDVDMSEPIPYDYTSQAGTLALVVKTDLSGVEIIPYTTINGRIIITTFLYDAQRYKNGGLVTKILASAIPVTIKKPNYVELELSELDNAAANQDSTSIVSTQNWKIKYFPCCKGTTYRITASWNEELRRYFTCIFTSVVPAVGVTPVQGEKILLYNETWTGNETVATFTSNVDGYCLFQIYKNADLIIAKAEEVNTDIACNDDTSGKFTKLTFANWNMAHYNLGSGVEHRIDTDEEFDTYLPIYRKVYSKIDADIISLCEYELLVQKNCTNKTTRRLLLPQYPYYKDCDVDYYNGTPDSRQIHSNGLALYSKLPIRNITEHQFTNVPSGKTRYYYDGDLYLDGRNIKVVGTHLTHDVDHTYAPLQMQELITAFADYKHVIIMADWNSAPADFQPLKDAGYSLANNDYYGSIRTYWDREEWYQGCMDNIAVKGGVISNVRVFNSNEITGEEVILSDHFPIACDVVFYD